MAKRSRSEPTRRAVLAMAGAAAFGTPALATGRLVVFAAASLKPPLDEIVAKYGDVSVSYGGSGTLARQVAAGAPADLVLLAAVDWMDWLGEQGVLAAPPMTIAQNRLVVAGGRGAEPMDLTAAVLLDRLGPDGRLAIGDPVSVPAGRYARQALERLGLWEAVADRLLLAEDVRAALSYVARGDVPLAIVYRSDTHEAGVSAVAEIPATAHDPILYPGAVVAGGAPDASALLARIAASEAVFAAHGFGA